jgi:hypothetical protein
MDYRVQVRGRIAAAGTIGSARDGKLIRARSFVGMFGLPFAPFAGLRLAFGPVGASGGFAVTIHSVAWVLETAMFECDAEDLNAADIEDLPTLAALASRMTAQGFTVSRLSRTAGDSTADDRLSERARPGELLTTVEPEACPGVDGADDVVRPCRHCGEAVRTYVCPKCKVEVIDQCPLCHGEAAHGIISDQNIHFVGNRSAIKNDELSPAQANAIRILEEG